MIVSRKNLYLTGALLFCVSGAIQADVPYVFQEGDTIRADEINENFRHFGTEVGSLSESLEESGGKQGSEPYIYSQKDLTVGRSKLTVLGQDYDIVQLDTLSFKDHSLFTVKFPEELRLDTNRKFAEEKDILDSNPISYGGGRGGVFRERRLEENDYKFDRNISGYPAHVYALVTQRHQILTLSGRQPSESEWNEIKWNRHSIWFGTRDGEEYLRLYLYGPDPNPDRSEDDDAYYFFNCNDLEFERGSYPQSFDWFQQTNTFSGLGNSPEPDMAGLAGPIAECKSRKSNFRKNVYNTYMTIRVNAIVELDDSTLADFDFDFDESRYLDDLRAQCSGSGEMCTTTFSEGERDFSNTIDQQTALAKKTRREEYIQELFSLFDHIVISNTAGN